MTIIPASVSSKVSMALLRVGKHSPALMVAGGVVGVVGTAVLASQATLKVGDILDDSKDTLEKIRTVQHPDYSEDDRKRDRVLVYAKTTIKIAKLYAPTVVVAGLTIGLMIQSHQILNRRNVALGAAYQALDSAYKKYRQNVIDEFGAEKDRSYILGCEQIDVEVVDEDGRKDVKTKEVTNNRSPYGKLFNEYNKNFQNVPEYNLLFVRGIQNYCNDLLQSRGYLFLNEVYEQLGFDATTPGCVVGWLANSKDGDGYVDFGLFEEKEALRIFDYATGREGELFLDFNVDGVIYDKI